jgi:hypothetical protein
MLANPGIPERVKNEIKDQALQTANSSYAGAGEAIQRNAAATGNNAGSAAALAQLGRDQAGTLSDINRQNDIAFQQEAQRQKETALSGLSNLYGQQSSNYNTLAGILGGISSQPVGTRSGTSNQNKGYQGMSSTQTSL